MHDMQNHILKNTKDFVKSNPTKELYKIYKRHVTYPKREQ